jgi:predicted anti-sigma-YlaC factor YlaD
MTGPEPPATTPGGDAVLVVACREFVELVTEYLEGSLSAELEQAIASHLELCDPCVEYLDQMRGTVGLLRTLPTESLPPVARNQLLEVYNRLHGTTSPAS